MAKYYIITLSLAFCLLTTSASANDVEKLPQFVDVAAESGLNFRYEYGLKRATKLLHTTPGGGGWLDYNDDGLLDVYCVNGAPITEDADQTPLHNRLFRQNEDHTFTDVTSEAGVGDTGFGNGCAFGDYDGDGDTDIFVTNYGLDVLYRNNGDGSFTDVTDEAGVAGAETDWSTSAVWVDVDNDGHLDLYVVHYIDYKVEHGIPCAQEGIRSVCTPREFGAQPDSFFHNNGDGTFTEESAKRGLRPPPGKGLGVIDYDYDGDGDVDLYVANDTTQNYLFQNRGDGTFSEVSLFSGVGFNEDGIAESGMGVAFGDVDSDGDPDLFVTNFQNETNTLYANHGKSFFMDETFRRGLGASSLLYLAFGTGLFDADNDGDLDLFAANGHIAPRVEEFDETAKFAQTNQLWLNDGSGNFIDRSADLGPAFENRYVSRAAAFADYDNDGDTDILVVNNNGPAALYRNDWPSTAASWIGFDLRLVSGAPAIGAGIRMTVGDGSRARQVRVGGSYLAQHDSRIVFALPESGPDPQFEILWTNGATQGPNNYASGAYHRVQWDHMYSDPPISEGEEAGDAAR